MKIIDRYLLRQLFGPLMYCFLAFTMVFIVADLFDNLPDFVKGKASLLSVLQFYLLLIPASLIYLVPVSLMLAELWCLTALTKNNELTAMRACGVSLLRLMAPFVAVGVLASVAVSVLNETVAPDAAYRNRQFIKSQSQSDKLKVYLHGPLPFKNELARRTWMVGRFNALTFAMDNVEVIQHDEGGMDLYKITAEKAEWLDGRWWFEQMKIQRYDAYGNPRGAPEMASSREMAELTETPVQFLNEVKDPQYMSAFDLQAYLRTRRSISPDEANRYRVDFHSRLALPWCCLVVTLMGIPFGNQTGRKGAIRGVMLCLALFFSAWIMILVGIWCGKNGLVTPWVGGWGPVLLLLGAGGLLTFRMR